MPWAAWEKAKGTVHPSGTKKLSMSSSTVSLSPSQMNNVIMNMLNVNSVPSNGSCQVGCRGDPITTAGQRNQMVKMLVIILIPILTLIGLSGNSFGTTLNNYVTARKIRETLRLSLDMSYMVRSLQRERDASALYLSSISSNSKAFLLNRYKETDAAIQSMPSWPVDMATTLVEFESSESFLAMLNRHRYELDSLELTFRDELDTYSEWIELFTRWFYASIAEDRLTVNDVWKSFVAYLELLVAADYIGKERAMGVIFFNKGYFQSRDDYLYFVEAQDAANASFTSARLYSDMAREIFDAEFTENTEILAQIQDMRGEVKAKSQVISPSGSSERAEYWFENMTFYQDIVREIMSTIVKRLDGVMANKQRSDLNTIIVICLLFSAVVILCPIIVYIVYSLTLDIQRCSVHIAARTKELSKEKKRTDTLLYQMLPKQVADQLKRNEIVETEEFKEATIMFCDIVGFTEISSRSSPLQSRVFDDIRRAIVSFNHDSKFGIVEMLNMIYSCLDDRIEMHDVYKVETIGDAYLVVSGVPKLNGILHASEMASLTLDIMEHVNRMEIQHIPGTFARLRIGIHSGPVVAGIVGTKMPHYCVFGESVNVAARIEALGLPCKIHISETTMRILTSLGGFQMKPREGYFSKEDHDLMMAFEGNVQTYWLIGKDGYALLDSDVSTTSPTQEHISALE